MILFGILTLINPREFLRRAHADGVGTETLPPSVIYGKQVALYMGMSPEMFTEDCTGPRSIHIRLFDAGDGDYRKVAPPIAHITYLVTVSRVSKELKSISFHSHTGPLTLNILPKVGPNIVLTGHRDSKLDSAWVASDNENNGDAIFDLQSMILREPGLYHFQISILGIWQDSNTFKTSMAPTSGLSVSLLWEGALSADESGNTVHVRFTDLSTPSNEKLWASKFDIIYSLAILDRTDHELLMRANLVARKGADTLTSSFPLDDRYRIIVRDEGIQTADEKIDRSRNGLAGAIIVVPEFPKLPITGAVAIALLLSVRSGRHVLFRRYL